MDSVGYPVTIVRVQGRRKYLIDEDAFNSIIDQCGDYPIAIYSQNGKRRKGKSLALNYMMLYLSAEFGDNWMDSSPLRDEILTNASAIQSENGLSAHNSENKDLDNFDLVNFEDDVKNQGFIWKDGDDDTTQGITMWSKPYIVTQSNGQKIAVLLMDCQGNASDNSDNVDNGVIFSLSILLSSVFIYNVSGDLDNLTLQFFHQYADFAIQVLESNSDDKFLPSIILSDENEGPKYNTHFQELVIWVRDWLWTSQYPLGLYSECQMPSNASMNFKLDKINPNFDENKQSCEVRSVRVAINSMFQRVSCLLSPFPGEEVISKGFNGKVAPESEFGKCLKNIMETLLSPSNIAAKFIGNEQLSREKLKEYFRKWAAVYRDTEKLPKFKSATETTHELICRDTIKKCWDHYMNKMTIVSKLPTPIEPNAFNQRHSDISKECVDMYNASAQVGLFQVKLKYMKELVKQIEISYTSFVDSNNERWKRIHQDL